MAENPNNVASTIPVSYTHLDVYKRQHLGLEGFSDKKEPVLLTLYTLSNLNDIYGNKEIYILENPSVFSWLCEKYPDKSFVCTNGQLRFSAFLLLDQLLSLIHILERLTEYEFSIPRIDVEVTKEQLWDKIHGRWRSIENWFLGTAGAGSEAGKVFDTTNEIIRRITRYATRISEQNHSGANRREEYAKIARLFWDCKTIEEAHRLSAVVFGIEKPLHLKGDIQRATESINSGVYEEPPAMFTAVSYTHL